MICLCNWRSRSKAVRTTFLLDWIMNVSMRRAVHQCTTKIERHHKFAKHLAFGEHGLLRSNDPSDQEKAIVYNELVANAVGNLKRFGNFPTDLRRC